MLGVVESATGGYISKLITDIPGSSDYYKGSVIAYRNQVKIKLIGVNEETINLYGAVSPQVAGEMAAAGRKLLATDICVADTGIAGPGGGTEEKAVGLFFIGLSHQGGTDTRKYEFTGNRQQNRRQAAQAVLEWLKEHLLAMG